MNENGLFLVMALLCRPRDYLVLILVAFFPLALAALLFFFILLLVLDASMNTASANYQEEERNAAKCYFSTIKFL